jgi:hypothetical protein
MRPEEETVEDVLVRKRDAEKRIDEEIREAKRTIQLKHASELARIDEDLNAALVRHAMEIALRALTPEQLLKVYGN